jgi:ribonuclease E
MEWGFEGQETEETVSEPAEEAEGEREGARRGRRRRRRGRRDDRPEHRAGGEQPAFARNGEADDAGPDRAPDEERVPTFEDEPLDEPAGLGEQPSTARGEDDREDRRGKRRRRGRRGGRRGGRDRDAPRQPDDRTAQESLPSGPNGAAPHEDVQHAHEGEPQSWPEQHATAEDSRVVENETAEPRHSRPEPAPLPAEPSWATADTHGAAREEAVEAPSRGSPSAVADAPPPVRESEPEPEDPSRPARKGWWQRKFSGG